MKEKNFFQLKTGDVVWLNDNWFTIKGRSLGRDWCAVRTSKGLHHVKKDAMFTIVDKQ